MSRSACRTEMGLHSAEAQQYQAAVAHLHSGQCFANARVVRDEAGILLVQWHIQVNAHKH